MILSVSFTFLLLLLLFLLLPLPLLLLLLFFFLHPLLFLFSSLFFCSSQSIQERSLNKFERRTIELEEIIAENRRKETLKEGSLSTTKNLLQKAEQRLFQLDSTQSRNSDLESAIITLKGIQGEGCNTYHSLDHTTPHHIASHHMMPNPTTPHHSIPYHITPHNTTPHHTKQCYLSNSSSYFLLCLLFTIPSLFSLLLFFRSSAHSSSSRDSTASRRSNYQ